MDTVTCGAPKLPVLNELSNSQWAQASGAGTAAAAMFADFVNGGGGGGDRPAAGIRKTVKARPNQRDGDGPSWGPEFQLAQRKHRPPGQVDRGAVTNGAIGSRAAPWAANSRPGDGPVEDRYWGRTEPVDYLHDTRQHHKPLHGIQRGLDGGEVAAHASDVQPDPRRVQFLDANMEVPALENRWGTKAGAYSTISHHGHYSKKTADRTATAFQTSEDIVQAPWAGLRDTRVAVPADELGERRTRLGPSQGYTGQPLPQSRGDAPEGRRTRDPRRTMPEDALRRPYARGGHAKASDTVGRPPNFGAPVAGSSQAEAIVADVAGVPQVWLRPWPHLASMQQDHVGERCADPRAVCSALPCLLCSSISAVDAQASDRAGSRSP